jgi:hypothetical protein
MDNEGQDHMAAEHSNGNLRNMEMSNQSADDVVSFCVGGTSYATTLGTLTAVPSSYLAILFGDQSLWQPSSTLPGSSTPFIDRDGELFRFVLAYLRSVRDCAQQQQPVLLPDNPLQLQQLKAEADFYGLPGEQATLSTFSSMHELGLQHQPGHGSQPLHHAWILQACATLSQVCMDVRLAGLPRKERKMR